MQNLLTFADTISNRKAFACVCKLLQDFMSEDFLEKDQIHKNFFLQKFFLPLKYVITN